MRRLETERRWLYAGCCRFGRGEGLSARCACRSSVREGGRYVLAWLGGRLAEMRWIHEEQTGGSSTYLESKDKPPNKEVNIPAEPCRISQLCVVQEGDVHTRQHTPS